MMIQILKLEVDSDFCSRKFWRRILNKLLEPWHEFMSIAQLTELLQSQFYNFKISAGILNKMNKTPGDHQFVTSKAKLQIRTLNSNQIIPISSWSGGSIRELLLHHLAISLKVLLKMKFQSRRSRIWYWRVRLITWWWWWSRLGACARLASSSRGCVSNQFARGCAGKLKIRMISWRRFKNFQNWWWNYWIKQGPIAIAIHHVITIIQFLTVKHEN